MSGIVAKESGKDLVKVHYINIMAEKLEKMVAEGKMTVETQEERVARMAKQQDMERKAKEAKQQIEGRKAFLKANIEFLRLEVEFVNLQNELTEGLIKKHNLQKESEAIEATFVSEEVTNDQDTNPDNE